MPVKRIENLKIENREFMTLIYGMEEDTFVDKGIKKMDIKEALYIYLKRKGFRNILYYSTTDRFFSYDESSINSLFFQVENRDTEKKSTSEPNDKRPLGKINLLRRNRNRNRRAASATGIRHRDGMYFLLTQGPLNIIDNIKGYFSIRQKTYKKSALIFPLADSDQFPMILRLSQELNEIERYPKIFKYYKILFIFSADNDQDLADYFEYNHTFSVDYFANNFLENDRVRGKTCYKIGPPDKDELKNIINNYRIKENYDVDWQDLDKILEGLFRKKLKIKDIDRMFADLADKNINYNNLLNNNIVEPVEFKPDYDRIRQSLDIIKGQDDNLDLIVKKLKLWFRMKAKKPLSFFLVGSSGVGKTFTVKRLNEALKGMGYQYIYLAMSEYMDEISRNKIFGAPPGYVGYGEDPILEKEIKKSKRLIILFDEIEKAHQDILTSIMQLLDEGKISFADGYQGDFRECIIFFTSNLKRDEMLKEKNDYLSSGKDHRIDDPEFQQAIRDIVKSSGVKPEVAGRINHYIVYNTLSAEAVMEISLNMIRKIGKELTQKDIVHVAPEILADLALQFGNSSEGLRPIEKDIENLFSDILEENDESV